MIPGYSELPETAFEELTKNPQLLAWFADVQRQLISSTVDLNGIGCTRILWNDTGADINPLQEVEATDGLTLSYIDGSGVVQRSAVTLEGRWLSSSGGFAAGNAREMTRIS